MDRLERRRLMLVFTHRPIAVLDQLDSDRISHTVLPLAPLGLTDGQTLLAAFFGHEWIRSSGKLCNRILERASGNPLFVEEIVRRLIEVGVLQRDGSQWRVARGGGGGCV